MRRIGLDIGVTHVRVAEVEFSGKSMGTHGHGALTAFAQAPLPPGSVVGGDVLDIPGVTVAIKKALGAAGVSTKDVVVGVGSESVIVREIEVPEMPMPQLRSSLPYQVSEMLPMSPDEALLDFYPTAHRVDGTMSLLRGILVAAPKTTVSQKLLAVEAAGLRPRSVDLNAFALLRAQYTPEFDGRVVAFVDIGARTTNVAIVQDGQPRLVRTLSSGGHDTNDAIASALHLDIRQAEEVKIQTGMSNSGPQPVQGAEEAISTTTRALIETVRNTFVYYTSNNPGEGIELVVISGGGAHLPGLGQYLASATRLPVRYGNAFARVTPGKKISADSLRGLEARVPVAIGLALGEAVS